MRARIRALLARRWARVAAIVVAIVGAYAAVGAFSYGCVWVATWVDERYAPFVKTMYIELAAIAVAAAIIVAVSVTPKDPNR